MISYYRIVAKVKNILDKSRASAYNCYSVTTPQSNGEEGVRILQLFPAAAEKSYETVKKALKLQGNVHGAFFAEGDDGVYSVLLKINYEDRLTWQRLSREPLTVRLDAIVKIAEQMIAMEQQGIVMNGLQLDAMLYTADGNISVWDYSSVLVAEETDQALLQQVRYANVLELVKLSYYAIVGKKMPVSGYKLGLMMALGHKLSSEHQSMFYEDYDKWFANTQDTSLQELISEFKFLLECLQEPVTPATAVTNI